ncbi:MAG: YdeI/OmpD-associated family protein [Bacteroidota bacterium]
MSKADQAKQLRVSGIDGWTRWLEQNHDREKVVWLVFLKKGAGAVPLDYPMALDEALCYGWVDSLLKKIDEREYMRKFTPRKPGSTWSEVNKKSVERLIGEGRMKPPGFKTIEAARQNGMWDKGIQIPQVDDSLPGALLLAFQSNPVARDHYFGLSSRCQKQYNIWINYAKRPGTIKKRVDESIALLEQGKELGLK